MAVSIAIFPLSYLSIMGPVSFYAFGIAFVMPAMTTASLAPFPGIAGAAAAAMGFVQIGSGLVGGLVATAIGDPVLGTQIVIPALGLTAIVAYTIYRMHGRQGAHGRVQRPEEIVPVREQHGRGRDGAHHALGQVDPAAPSGRAEQEQVDVPRRGFVGQELGAAEVDDRAAGDLDLHAEDGAAAVALGADGDGVAVVDVAGERDAAEGEARVRARDEAQAEGEEEAGAEEQRDRPRPEDGVRGPEDRVADGLREHGRES